MSTTCSECDVKFARKDSMLRHYRNSHEVIKPYQASRHEYASSLLPSTSPRVILQHPFRMVVIAPSFAGKTTFVCNLLKQAESTISVPVQRIVWCYSQYQPLYDTLKKEIPHIEFYRGIPDDITEDYFFNPEVANLMIIDDLMTQVKNDRRIGDMFSNGRHRNTSVILLQQNLFPQGTASRDIALNFQYMLLFNNPVDRMQIATLARRIYPKNSEKLLNGYQNAIAKPYGNLLIDLRVTTPEHQRPIPNPLGENKCEQPDDIKVETPRVTDHTIYPNERIEMPSCDHCGTVFGTLQDLQRHSKTWCQENNQTGYGMESKPPRWFTDSLQSGSGLRGIKRSISEESNDYEMPKQMILIPFDQLSSSPWTNLIREQLAIDWGKSIEDKRNEIMKDGFQYDIAQTKAVNHYLPQMRKELRKRIVEFVLNIDKLFVDPLYKEIKRTIGHCKNAYDMSTTEAIKQAVKIRKELIDENLLPELEDRRDDD